MPRNSYKKRLVLKYWNNFYLNLFEHFHLWFYPSAPAAPPKDIVSKKINSTALNIKFGLIVLDDRNGIIDNYEVKICKLNDTNCRTFIVAENDATKSLDVGGLEKWRDYMYSVTGCTLGGCGGTSPMAIQRTDEDCKKLFHFYLKKYFYWFFRE